jgi:hypothetical protein
VGKDCSVPKSSPTQLDGVATSEDGAGGVEDTFAGLKEENAMEINPQLQQSSKINTPPKTYFNQ